MHTCKCTQTHQHACTHLLVVCLDDGGQGIEQRNAAQTLRHCSSLTAIPCCASYTGSRHSLHALRFCCVWGKVCCPSWLTALCSLLLCSRTRCLRLGRWGGVLNLPDITRTTTTSTLGRSHGCSHASSTRRIRHSTAAASRRSGGMCIFHWPPSHPPPCFAIIGRRTS